MIKYNLAWEKAAHEAIKNGKIVEAIPYTFSAFLFKKFGLKTAVNY